MAGLCRATTLCLVATPAKAGELSDRFGFGLIQKLWSAELLSVGGNSISVGTIVTAVILFILGFVISRWLSRLLGRLLHRRVGLERGAAAAFEGLSFYFMLVLFFLLALRTVNIPLTAFTVAGGALAIGIGFGSQNIVNNFISGLILMAERPIKVGDIIDVEGTFGRVERIGARSTRIRTFDNIHIVIPNSAAIRVPLIERAKVCLLWTVIVRSSSLITLVCYYDASQLYPNLLWPAEPGRLVD